VRGEDTRLSAAEPLQGSHPHLHWGAAPMLAVLAALWAHAPAADTPPPEQVITTTAAALVKTMAARHDELAADRRKLNALVDELLRPRFDLDTSCRLILGPHWKTATPAQRQRFVAAFQGFLVASYGHALLEFKHDTLKVLPAKEPLVGSSTQVRTTMKLTSGRTFQVDFYMRLDDRGWRIVDVLVEGVSYVRSYRGDFGLEIRASSLDALIVRLEDFAKSKLSEAK
jgi:phospholipid transport system substrate-binding protein